MRTVGPVFTIERAHFSFGTGAAKHVRMIDGHDFTPRQRAIARAIAEAIAEAIAGEIDAEIDDRFRDLERTD